MVFIQVRVPVYFTVQCPLPPWKCVPGLTTFFVHYHPGKELTMAVKLCQNTLATKSIT